MPLSNLLSKLSTGILIIALSLGLSACGYQLRGSDKQVKLPASISIYADDQQLANAMAKVLIAAQVIVAITEHAANADSSTHNIADVRFTNTNTDQEAVAYDSNGNPTHWRYSVNTHMLMGNNEDGKTFILQEHQQIALHADSGAGSANDLIIANTWQGLYKALAHRVLGILGRQP